MATPRFLRLILVPVIAALGLTFSSCGEGENISLSVVPGTYKFTKEGPKTKNFNIQVTGIGEVAIDNVELIQSGTDFKFSGGIANCLGEKVGDNLPECIETIELPTFKSGLSAKLKVVVKNLKEEVQLSS